MTRTRFTHIRLILKEASTLFDEGRLTVDDFEKLIDAVEIDYKAIIKEMEAKEMSGLPKLFQFKIE